MHPAEPISRGRRPQIEARLPSLPRAGTLAESGRKGGEPMSEWRALTWGDAMQLGYEALHVAKGLYDEIDAQLHRSNVDIEKHLRRAEVKLAEAQAWFAMARELGTQRADDSRPVD